MKGKFIVYAFLVSLVCTALSWSTFTDGGGGSSSYRSGSTWSSNSGVSGGSWGGGGHK